MADLQDRLSDILQTIEAVTPELPSDHEALKTLWDEYTYTAQAIEVRESIHNCTTCHLQRLCKRPVPIIGESHRNILVALSEAPEEIELLKRSASRVGVAVDDFVNVVSCRPPHDRTPSKDEILACGENLAAQIELLDPWMILCFGSIAMESAAVTKGMKVTRDHGIVFTTKFVGKSGKLIWGYPFFHPAFVMRQMEVRKQSKESKEHKVQNSSQSAIVYCKQWEEDWWHLKAIQDAHNEIGGEALREEMVRCMSEAPYRPDQPLITESGRKTYLQRMDEAEKDIPF